jgi:hypothetical protein
MPRVYTVVFHNVAVAAAQDLFELQAADDKPIELLSVIVTDSDSETNEQLRTTIQKRTGAFTGGSGGTAPTPAPTATVETAAGFTAEVNNTTRATGGTQVMLHPEGWAAQGGIGATNIPEATFKTVQGEALIVGLEAAPGASRNLNGVAYVREYP